MIIFIDIDLTLCYTPTNQDGTPNYEEATPIQRSIDIVNRIFQQGHTVVLWTARGATTKVDYRDLTEGQLKQWGCKYSDLRLDKPYYDIFVDDKAHNSIDKLAEILG